MFQICQGLFKKTAPLFPLESRTERCVVEQTLTSSQPQCQHHMGWSLWLHLCLLNVLWLRPAFFTHSLSNIQFVGNHLRDQSCFQSDLLTKQALPSLFQKQLHTEFRWPFQHTTLPLLGLSHGTCLKSSGFGHLTTSLAGSTLYSP